MSNQPVFNINQKLFNQLIDWQNKMEVKEQAESEDREVNKKSQKVSETQKDKL
ncbi:MAG: hypothetical protein QNJ68_06390 [Microcoleaceae cyanobacterium MO_207.B10]|nr:hypothetical protein [Microcoleaceae cyanobacterium MO_207.B10]